MSPPTSDKNDSALRASRAQLGVARVRAVVVSPSSRNFMGLPPRSQLIRQGGECLWSAPSGARNNSRRRGGRSRAPKKLLDEEDVDSIMHHVHDSRMGNSAGGGWTITRLSPPQPPPPIPPPTGISTATAASMATPRSPSIRCWDFGVRLLCHSGQEDPAQERSFLPFAVILPAWGRRRKMKAC